MTTENSNLTSISLGANSFISTTTSTFMISPFGHATVEKSLFKETSNGNFIEVVKRQNPNPNYHLLEQSDRVFKEIYGITKGDDGQDILKLIQIIEGSVTPAHYVGETVSFPE